MLERLLEIERDWFFAINGSHTWWLDHIMLALGSPWAWCPPILLILYFFLKRRKDSVFLLICTVLTSTVTVLVTEALVKPFFTRLRPTNHPMFIDNVRILNEYVATGVYGFISGHSGNAFALAVITALIVKNKWYTAVIFLWATLMVYSRVYLAAHFITDVIPGMLTGVLIGWLIYMIARFFVKTIIKKNLSYEY